MPLGKAAPRRDPRSDVVMHTSDRGPHRPTHGYSAQANTSFDFDPETHLTKRNSSTRSLVDADLGDDCIATSRSTFLSRALEPTACRDGTFAYCSSGGFGGGRPWQHRPVSPNRPADQERTRTARSARLRVASSSTADAYPRRCGFASARPAGERRPDTLSSRFYKDSANHGCG